MTWTVPKGRKGAERVEPTRRQHRRRARGNLTAYRHGVRTLRFAHPMIAAHFLLVLVASLILASPLRSIARAEQPPLFWWNPGPSLDPTPRRLILNGQHYDIPRNSLAVFDPKKAGDAKAIPLRIFFPDLVGLTRGTIPCLDHRNFSSQDVVEITLTNGESVPGSRMLENMKRLVLPEMFAGPCGLEFYEDRGIEEQRFRHFFKKLRTDAEVSVLRCPKETASYAPLCNGAYNTGDGNHFYFSFHRKHLCEWEAITDRIFRDIASFRAGAAR
jgi:hypothetical protein